MNWALALGITLVAAPVVCLLLGLLAMIYDLWEAERKILAGAVVVWLGLVGFFGLMTALEHWS